MSRRPRRRADGAGLAALGLLLAVVPVGAPPVLAAGASPPAGPLAAPEAGTPQPGAGGEDDAAPERSAAAPPEGEEQALALLERAVTASRTETWSGTQFVAAWSRTGVQSAVVDVSHDPGAGSWVRVRPTVGPDETRVPDRSEGRGAPDGDDAWVVPEPGDVAVLDSRLLRLLEDNYRLSVAGTGRSIDRSATVVLARRPDGRTAARFWLDDETGLVLHRELLDRQGSLVRVSYFVDLQRSARPVPGRAPTEEAGAASGEVLTPGEVAELRREGWVVPARLPRGLSLLEVRRHQQNAAGPTMHLAYSDGLATLSVFVQEGSLAPAQDGWTPVDLGGATVHAGAGTPLRYAWDADGRLWVVLADAPPDTLDAAVAALPHEPAEPEAAEGDGVVDRVQRGLRRIGSWLNPFD